MASTNKTSHYNLSQYIGSDKPTYLVDYNTDMSNIDNAIYNADLKGTQANLSIGDISELVTTNKNNVVAAINEVEEDTEDNKTLINQIKNTVDNLINTIYPIGSLYFSTTNVNPGTYLGGTWIQYAPGRVLVGQDVNDSDFDTLGAIGGEKEHTLSINEIPSHSHQTKTGTGSGPYNYNISGLPLGTEASTILTNNVGGGQPHNNLQPYVVINIWIRNA